MARNACSKELGVVLLEVAVREPLGSRLRGVLLAASPFPEDSTADPSAKATEPPRPRPGTISRLFNRSAFTAS